MIVRGRARVYQRGALVCRSGEVICLKCVRRRRARQLRQKTRHWLFRPLTRGEKWFYGLLFTGNVVAIFIALW